MKRHLFFCVALLAMVACAAAAAPAPSTLHAEHPWIRWLPANLPAAAYVVIANDGSALARLTGASSSDYTKVMLHRSQEVGGVDRMTAAAGMDIPAHGTAALAPGGYHLMLMKPAHPIKPGDTVKVTLHFAGGATLQVDFPVRPANASGPAD
ncbi:MAG: copper chaperone PCu(A)C [Rhodanobacteraceae bacterium]